MYNFYLSFVDGFVAVVVAKTNASLFSANRFDMGTIAKKKAFFQQPSNQDRLEFRIVAAG